VLEERMTANLLDRGMAFQVAEAGLREAESRFDPPNFPLTGCVNGMCAMPAADATDRWLDPGFNGWFAGAKVDSNMDAPLYFAENLGMGVNWPMCDAVPENKRSAQCETPRYRVTSRSVQDGRASVILQTTYAGK
jgi:type IV pilus assembly protein PilX